MIKQVTRKLVIPRPIPWDYAFWDSDWHTWVKGLDGQNLVLIEDNTLTEKGYKVANQPHYIPKKIPITAGKSYAGSISNWIPADWCHVIEVVGYCNSCGGVAKHRLMCPVAPKPSS